MRKQLAIGGLVAVAAVAGTTGVAIAHAQGTSATTTASATPTGTATTGAPGASATKGTKAGKAANGAKVGNGAAGKEILGKLKDFQHAEWVTKGDANAYVTHEAILGTVQSVSASSITVSSADGTSMTFAVDGKTMVRQPKAKGAGATKDPNAAKPTIADVKTGQTVLVGGAKTPDLTAKNVLVRAG
ncbi:MAG: hypothetical protein ABJA89_08895 [Lapillicoccus sp.]